MRRNYSVEYEKELTDISTYLKEWGFREARPAGQGAFSRVYRVREEASGRVLACKVSRREELFRRERVLLSGMAHPLFPKYYGSRQQGPLCVLFLEFVSGTGMEALLARRVGLSAGEVIRVGAALADGLLALHSRPEPVLFRDLKPGNIMIREDGGVKLLDLGSAGTVEEFARVVTGTPGYAAPEQLVMGGQTGIYSDVYALGKVMERMLGGEDGGRYRTNGHRRAGNKTVGRQAARERGLRRLIEECTRDEPQRRPPDMRCVLHRLALCGVSDVSDEGGEYLYLKNVVRNGRG